MSETAERRFTWGELLELLHRLGPVDDEFARDLGEARNLLRQGAPGARMNDEDDEEDEDSPAGRMARVRTPELDPQPLEEEEYYALEDLKGEYWNDKLDGPYLDVWLKVVLRNAGLRRAVQLAPIASWRQALDEAEAG